MSEHLIGDDIRIWFARESDREFVRHLYRQFRNFEFFYAPEESVLDEIRKGNILCFDYRKLEAGYVWLTFPRHGRARINHLAVSEELWRNKVGTSVMSYIEDRAPRYGCWAIYLSCNDQTPGHSFWPTVGFKSVIERPAGRRGGLNLIWAKLISSAPLLFPALLSDVKNSYLWLGLAIGAAFMYAAHCQTINAYTLRVLRDMREEWRP